MPSSRRYKKDVRDMGRASSSGVMQLRRLVEIAPRPLQPLENWGYAIRRWGSLTAFYGWLQLVLILSTHLPAWGWEAHLKGTANEVDSAQAVAVDPKGNVLAAGVIQVAHTPSDFTLVKLSGADSTELSHRVISGSGNGADDVTIEMGSANGTPGSQVSIDVVLNSNGAEVAGTQNDISFDADTPIVAGADGQPDCTENPQIQKSASTFSFQPPDCTPGVDCHIRALIVSLDNVESIPNGSVLYTCHIQIAEDALLGEHPLGCSGADSGTPDGLPLATTCTDGAVVVSLTPLPTDTATYTATFTTTATRTLTTTPTPTPTPTPIRCVGDCDGDGLVFIDELIRGANIALGLLPIDACRAFGPEGPVPINRLVRAVGNALTGCGVSVEASFTGSDLH